MVRVELLTGPSSLEPSVDRALTPSTPVLELRPPRLSSGRYGLISASIIESDSPQSSSSISVSSDAASSPSEQESDMEDEHFCVPTVLRDTQGKPSVVKIPAFRSFMREIYHTTVPHSPVISDLPDDLEDAPGSPPSADAVIHTSPVVVVSEPPLRSHSPIDLLESPSPEAQQSEPAVIGAWPASRPESPHHSLLQVEAGPSEVPLATEADLEPEPVPVQPSPCQTRITPPNTFIELVHCLNPQTPFFPTSGPFSNSIASDFGLPSVLPPPPPPHRLPSFHLLHKVVTDSVNSEFKGSFKSVEARVIRRSRQLVTDGPTLGPYHCLAGDRQRS